MTNIGKQHNQSIQELIIGHATIAKKLFDPNADMFDIGLDELKAALNALGVNQRGWRLLVDFWDALMRPLHNNLIDERRPLSSLENLAIYLTLLQKCEMDMIPPHDLVIHWLALCRNNGMCPHIQEIPVLLFRASWKEYMRRQNSTTAQWQLCNEELPEVAKWYFLAATDENFDENLPKRGWAHLRRESIAWRERCTFKASTKNMWPSLLNKEYAITQGVCVVELLNAEAVIEEGQVMRHCVANTLCGCDSGSYRVFSIRHPATEERLATLGLILRHGQWCIDDMRAQDNEDPPAEFDSVASEIEQMCRDAQFSHWQKCEGALAQRLQSLYLAAIDEGMVGFREASRWVLNALRDDAPYSRRIGLRDLQSAYFAVLESKSRDPQPELRMAVGVKSLEELLPYESELEDSSAPMPQLLALLEIRTGLLF